MQPETIHQPTIRDILTSAFFRERRWAIAASILSIGGTSAVIWLIFMSAPDVFGVPWALGSSAILLVLLTIILGSFWQRLRQHVLWRQYSIASGGVHSFDEAPSSRMAFVFQRGINRNISDQITNPSSLPFASIGNYSYCYYITYRDQQIPIWRRRVAFISLKLPRQLPHIILDSTANNFLKRLSEYDIELQSLQRLSLEGDFNHYFKLYVPPTYEHDALYIFSPDIMELMINTVSRYDIEIIDDTLYLFAPGKLNPTDTPKIDRLAAIAEVLMTRLNKNVSRYADQTTAEATINLVAPAGQRLKKRTISILALAILAYIIFMLAPLLI